MDNDEVGYSVPVSVAPLVIIQWEEEDTLLVECRVSGRHELPMMFYIFRLVIVDRQYTRKAAVWYRSSTVTLGFNCEEE